MSDSKESGSERPDFPDNPIESCPICGTSVTGEWGYDSQEGVYTLACDSPVGERHQVTARGLVFSVRMGVFVPVEQYNARLERIASKKLDLMDKVAGQTYYYVDDDENGRDVDTGSDQS